MQSETFGLRRPPLLMKNIWTQMSWHRSRRTTQSRMKVEVAQALLKETNISDKHFWHKVYLYIGTSQSCLRGTVRIAP